MQKKTSFFMDFLLQQESQNAVDKMYYKMSPKVD